MSSIRLPISVERLARAAALVDSMSDASIGKMAPTIAQLERLLKNDVTDIRRLAVDWFELSPPTDPEERTRFLISALSTKPRQVREIAIHACDVDPSSAVRKKCGQVKSKASAP